MYRVVVYAEGPGELAGRDRSRTRAPGEPLTEQELGAAHLLVRQCLEHTREMTAEEIRFEEPLRLRRNVAKGSMLHGRETLRQLLLWADERKRPHLAVVLVDADGKKDRQEELEGTGLRSCTARTIFS